MQPFLTKAQSNLPVVGLCIAAPTVENVEEFTQFIDYELAPSGINTLILRVDFNYDYTSRPELRDENPLTLKDVKSIVNVETYALLEYINMYISCGSQTCTKQYMFNIKGKSSKKNLKFQDFDQVRSWTYLLVL